MMTSEQLNAAHSTAKQTVCIAAAGSGKTSVLVERICWLLDTGARPQDICAVTFTSAAAREIANRVNKPCDNCDGSGVFWGGGNEEPQEVQCQCGGRREPRHLGHIGTLHALMLRLLRQHGNLIGLPAEVTVMPEAEADALIQSIADGLKVKASMKELQRQVELHLIANEVDAAMSGKVGIVAGEFCRHMRQTGELSYDALLHFGWKLVANHPETAPFNHLVVDECQDNAKIDWEIYKVMPTETDFYVGDFRQSIYRFRGADVHGFESKAMLDGFVSLTTNFRSSIAVVAASNRIAAAMQVTTAPAVPRPDAPAGAVTIRDYATAAEEQHAVAAIALKELAANKTVAILLRTNQAADKFRDAMQALGLPVQQVKPVGAAPDEKAGLALLRAMNAPCNDRLVLKMVAELAGTAAAASLKKRCDAEMTSAGAIMCVPDTSNTIIENADDIQELAAQFGGAHAKHAGFWLRTLTESVPMPCTLGDMLLAAQSRPEDAHRQSQFEVTTYHAQKGREFSVIILPAFEDDVWPGNADGDDHEELIRLFYVGVTRAQEDCHLSWCHQRPNDYKKWVTEQKQPSRFLKYLNP